jgi:hypothetical protein
LSALFGAKKSTLLVSAMRKTEMMGDEDVKKGKHTTDLISFVETPRSLFMVFHIHRFCLSNPYLSVPPHPPLPASSLMEKKMFSMLHEEKSGAEVSDK